jgi:hypothetical protein
MLRMNALKLLAAGGAYLQEFFGSLQFSFVRVEFGSRRDVSGLRVRQFRAENLDHRLSLSNMLAQLHQDARDSAGNDRRDCNLPVGVWLDDTRQPQSCRRAAGGDRRDRDARALDRFVAETDDDVWQRRIISYRWDGAGDRRR